MLDVALRIGLVVLARCGLDAARARGWLPQSLYVRSIMELLKKDDLDGAVSTFLRAYRRRSLTNEGLVVRDIIRAEIDVRQQILSRRRDQLHAEEHEILRSLLPIRRFIRCRFNPQGVMLDFHRLRQLREEQKSLDEGLFVLNRKYALIKGITEKDDPPAAGFPELERIS